MEVIKLLAELQKYRYPLRFESENGNLIIEIQYFITQNTEYESNNTFHHFAVTTDGWNLIIDCDFKSDSIFQDEDSTVDCLDINLSDLVKANKISI